jgi:hypothetical protein
MKTNKYRKVNNYLNEDNRNTNTNKIVVLQGTGGDTWQYKYEKGNYFAAKKGKNPKWILVTKPNVVQSIKNKFIQNKKSLQYLDNIQMGSDDSETSFGKNKTLLGVFKSWVRRTFPNVSELFFARNLSSGDFTRQQKLVMFNAVKNAIRRTGQKIGSVEYEDYGDNIVNKWFGPGGIKTMDMISNTLFGNPKFMVATTLGRFSYKIAGNKIIITDIYDFKKIEDAKTKPQELKGLNYPQKVYKVMKDNNVNPYVAIRHLGYLENPEGSPKSKPQINVSIPIKFTNTTA